MSFWAYANRKNIHKRGKVFMGLVAEAQRIKEVHPNYLILYKSGNFYKSFGKDAYILSTMFNYNIRIVDNNVPMCGFPINSTMKVRTQIEENQINYMLVDPRNNYEVDLKEEFNNFNNYEKMFEKAYSRTKGKKKINHIVESLIMIIDKPYFKDTIRRIEDILDENREV